MTVADVASLLDAPSGGSVDQLAMADAVDEGLPAAALDRIKEVLALSDAEMASVLGISAKTIQRLRTASDRRLSSVVSDRLYRMARLYLVAVEVLEDPAEATRWLGSPQLGLGRRAPVELMSTEAGSREVEALLLRLEHGVVS